MVNQKINLKECIEQLKSCNFECEAGKLENNIAFQQLEEVMNRLIKIDNELDSVPENIGEYAGKEEIDIINVQMKIMHYIIFGINL